VGVLHEIANAQFNFESRFEGSILSAFKLELGKEALSEYPSDREPLVLTRMNIQRVIRRIGQLIRGWFGYYRLTEV